MVPKFCTHKARTAMKMLKNLTTLSLVLISFASIAQEDNKTIQKLRTLYDEGKFLKLEYKCFTLSEHPEMRKHPMVWYYFSKSTYEISKNSEWETDYPDAWADAVKYATKFVQKDRKKVYTEEAKEYIEMIRGKMKVSADDFYTEKNYKKARKDYKILIKLNKQDHYAWFMRAACETHLKLTGDARGTLQTVLKMEKAMDAFEQLSDADQSLLKTNYETIFTADNGAAGGSGRSNP